MHSQQIVLAAINVVGGILVIGSYVQGIRTHPGTRDDAWGHVPIGLMPLYKVSMLLAAAGYFLFTYFVLFRLQPEDVGLANAFGYWLFILLYALILFPSALWMPLTFRMLEHPSRGLWWAVRVTLAVVGLASLGLLGTVLVLEHNEPTALYWLAIAGCVFFCIQTALLDAVVWPAYFPVGRQSGQSDTTDHP
jgi:hypothetical protein